MDKAEITYNSKILQWQIPSSTDLNESIEGGGDTVYEALSQNFRGGIKGQSKC